MVETTNSLKAILALSGDLISDITWLPQAFATLRAIELRCFREGNHDRGNHRVSFDQSVKAAGSAWDRRDGDGDGARLVSSNSSQRWTARKNWQNRDERRLRFRGGLVAQRDPGRSPDPDGPTTPHAWDYCGELLTLSGHTHGGHHAERRAGPARRFRY